MFRVKSDPELRHILAHMICAMDDLVAGRKRAAEYELHEIRNLVFFTDEEGGFREFIERGWRPSPRKKGRAARAARSVTRKKAKARRSE
jgi:hypothetical protein